MPPEVRPLEIAGLKLITPKRFGDDRGWFSETFNAHDLAGCGIDCVFVQDNHSFSVERGTVRGLHYQTPPHAQDKLVRVTRGRVLDVAVDIRLGSPTYGRHAAIELSDENWTQLFIPKGFAHGFCTLEPNSEIVYKVSDFYAAQNDAGILWNDPVLAIAWPSFAGSQLSSKDTAFPPLAKVRNSFVWTP